jgi:hypothetical protein
MNDYGDTEITDEDRTNEVGLFNTAESYWKSAGALYEAQVKTSHPLSPVRFLYYHAIELYLKAFLRGNGHSAKELRSNKFGHRICCLADRAAALGLPFVDEDKKVFSMMGTTDALIRSRYIQTGAVNWPAPEALDRACRSLRESIANDLKRKGHVIWL